MPVCAFVINKTKMSRDFYVARALATYAFGAINSLRAPFF